MASNKKWFKRALRALAQGDTTLWDLVKTKLVPAQVSFLEKEHAAGNINEILAEAGLPFPDILPDTLDTTPVEQFRDPVKLSQAKSPKKKAPPKQVSSKKRITRKEK